MKHHAISRCVPGFLHVALSLTVRMLILLSGCFYATSYAQVNVNVDIQGVSGELADNVRLFLSIEQQRTNPSLSEGRLQRLHNKAPQEITSALQPFGYYKSDIKSVLRQPSSQNWQATYTIDPGPQIPVGTFNFTLEGELRTDPAVEPLLTRHTLHAGEMFNHLKYEKLKTDLAKLAAERGYFNARFVEHRVEIDLVSYQAYITLRYDSGLRYHFGDILLQQDALDPDLLLRYISLEKNAPFSVNKLLDIQQALNDSDYFQTVEVSPGEPEIGSTDVPISIVVTPRKRHRFLLGIGYGTDTGARAKFGWELPRLNRRGHRLNTETDVSEIGYSLSTHYRVPVLNPRTDQMVYSAGVLNEKTDTSESTVRTIGASLNRGRGAWRESISLDYQEEDFIIGDEQGSSVLLMPGVHWSRTWGRDFINTLDGLRFDISLRGASDSAVSDTSFTQFQGGIKAITPLGKRIRMITRGRLGGTIIDEFNQLPSSVRFFAGGSQSVRGYAYQSLGPVDDDGEVIGGKHLMIGSIEFEHRLNGKWGVATFYDAGNAIDNVSDKLARGTGLGLRWRSPVGPVRIDLATAISRDGNPWRLHINIGPDL